MVDTSTPIQSTDLAPSVCEALAAFNIRYVEQLPGLLRSNAKLSALSEALGFELGELFQMLSAVVANNPQASAPPDARDFEFRLGHRVPRQSTR